MSKNSVLCLFFFFAVSSPLISKKYHSFTACATSNMTFIYSDDAAIFACFEDRS